MLAGGEVGNSARQVHDPQRAQPERGPADHHPTAAVWIAGTADKSPGRAQAEQRQRHRAHADQEVQHHGDNPSDRPGGVKPDCRRREDGGTKRGERHTVPLVGPVDVKVTSTTADSA